METVLYALAIVVYSLFIISMLYMSYTMIRDDIRGEKERKKDKKKNKNC